MLQIINNFYNPQNLGLIMFNFLNMHFETNHQSHANYYGGDRKLSYPTWESPNLEDCEYINPYKIFKDTWIEKTKIKPLHINTFFRKTKLEECKKSPSWKQYKPHKDNADKGGNDLAGLIYFNSSFLRDGTFIYNEGYEYEPTIIVGSQPNRCVYYSSDVWHSPSMEQNVQERWIQPFFIIYKDETYKKFLDYEAVDKHPKTS
jgi:hypothetical protein